MTDSPELEPEVSVGVVYDPSPEERPPRPEVPVEPPAPADRAPPKYGAEPVVAGQFQLEGGIKFGRTTARVYDLSEAKDMADWSDLLADAENEDPGVVVRVAQRQFDATRGRFLIYVEACGVLYNQDLRRDLRDASRSRPVKSQ